jgi:hypothetical protein
MKRLAILLVVAVAGCASPKQVEHDDNPAHRWSVSTPRYVTSENEVRNVTIMRCGHCGMVEVYGNDGSLRFVDYPFGEVAP